MHQVLIIAVFVIVFMRDAFTGPLWLASMPAWWIVSLSTLPLIAAWALLVIRVRMCTRAMDRHGSVKAVRRAEGAAALFRWAILAQHAASVLVLGLLDLVRRTIGDLILADELIVLLVPALAIAGGHWAMYPVERRIREAVLFRRIEQGKPVHPFPGRVRYVWASFRQSALFMGVPLTLILAWGEVSFRAGAALGLAPGGASATGIQLVGVVGILAISPPLMRRMWDTVPLGAGPLREHLGALCRRHRVRVRAILVWRTGGTIVNAAVLGLFARLRYIVLTDALLELLEAREVEAVVAHEMGHVRRHHVFWLGVSALGSVLLVSAPISLAADLALALTPLGALDFGETLVTGGAMAGVFAGVIVLLGLVSRRFEWQADAFAAQHLSGMTPEQRHVPIREEAAGAMSTALDRVAHLNGIDPLKFTWRHGSIRERQRRLAATVGQHADALPADKVARRVKVLALLAFVLGGAALLGETAIFGA